MVSLRLCCPTTEGGGGEERRGGEAGGVGRESSEPEPGLSM